ncbi:MAG: glycoside hydrolase family 2 TIM barrel-domain containing protein, partial [Candidatus Sumerlaeota bacterium]
MKRLSITAILVVLAMVLLSSLAGAEDIWLEGEKPDMRPEGDLKQFGVSFGDAHPEWLSDGSLLNIVQSYQDAKETFPPEGLQFGYNFEITEGGDYDLWFRLGFDFGRSDFEYRFDDGEWMTCEDSLNSIDLVMLMKFNPLSWAKLPSVSLEPGKHTITFRHLPFVDTNEKGEQKPARNLHKLDVIFLTQDPFHPNGKYRPGEDYKTEQDQQAAQKVYAFQKPNVSAGERSAVRLDGLWEIARWDEWTVDEATRLEPDNKLPEMDRLHWRGIEAPGNRNDALPEFTYAHRYVMRCKVDVPAGLAEKGFFLEFNNFIMIAGVFVNGEFCGGSRHFDTVWTCDVSDKVKPGQINEIAVVLKDIYYGMSPKQLTGRETDLYGARSGFSSPIDMTFNQSLGKNFDMPVSWGHGGTGRTGLIESVMLVACGRQYTTDVFPIPSVSRESLGLEVSAANPGKQDAEVEAVCKVVPWQKGRDAAAALKSGDLEPVLEFPPAKIRIPAGQATMVKMEKPFENADLWWPDDPNLYVVVTELRKDDQLLDTHTARFGFREWGWKGNACFTLNGVPWQFWAVHSSGNLAGDKDVYGFVEHCRRTGTNMLRYIHWANDWARRTGMTTTEILDVLDEEGIAVRFNGPIDGEVANYGANLTRGSRDDREANWDLWNNVIDQGLAWVRSYRNHPCLTIWSMENEVSYINANNLGQGPWVDPVFREFGEKIMQIDPTRPVMVDGGNALRPPEEWQTSEDIRALGYLPVNGAHYIEEHNVDKRDYPDAAYTNAHWAESPQRGAFPV